MNKPRQAHPPRRYDTDIGIGGPELGSRGRNPNVARHGDREPAADAPSPDSGDNRLRMELYFVEKRSAKFPKSSLRVADSIERL
jgi:hypothetical protein